MAPRGNKVMKSKASNEKTLIHCEKSAKDEARDGSCRNSDYDTIEIFLVCLTLLLQIALITLGTELRVLLSISPALTVSILLVIYFRHKHQANTILRKTQSRISRLEKRQSEIMRGLEIGNSLNLHLAKTATKREFEESRALGLSVMIAREGKLISFGGAGKEVIVGETENEPRIVTNRRFIIGNEPN